MEERRTMRPVWCISATLFALLISGAILNAHPGHDHPPNLRVWKDAEGLFEIEASFVQARDGRVQLCKHDGTLVWVSLDRLSHLDQAWVQSRVDEIRSLNQPTAATSSTDTIIRLATTAEAHNPQLAEALLAPSLAGAGILVAVAIGALLLKRRRVVVLPGLIVFGSLASLGLAVDQEAGQKEPPVIQKHFEPFKHKLKYRFDDTYFFVESDGFPDHPMMVGIKAWQQQVPLPQPYTGKNAWQIPLKPQLAEKPISAKTALFSGAIAVAVNGVPIFNALNNRSEDAFLIGELDEYGGHCGRGDDYHYHAAPVHLEKVVGKGNPIAMPSTGFRSTATRTPRGRNRTTSTSSMAGWRRTATDTIPPRSTRISTAGCGAW